MRKILIIIMFAVPLMGNAQKKEISQAKEYIKSGKDYDKAEKLMTDLLKDEKNRGNKKIYELWFKSLKGQYAQIGEKIYFKQKYDTVALYNIIHRMYGVAETLDSIEAKPNKKGKVDFDNREDNAKDLDKLRVNLYSGGAYNYRRGRYQEAFQFFNTYIDAEKQPLFASYNYMQNDTLMPMAAYLATACGYRLKNPEMTLKYCQLSLKNERIAPYTLHYMCSAYRTLKDDQAYEATLREGFHRFPDNPYFFPRLADLYESRMQSDSVLVVANRALEQYPDKPLFLLAKSVALLHLGRTSECIDVSQKLISKDAKLPDPYFNIATIYLNQALELEKKNEPRLYRDQLQELYKKARPYMESYRMLAPKQQNRWAPALYRIYLNLNLGAQFDEIDRLLKK